MTLLNFGWSLGVPGSEPLSDLFASHFHRPSQHDRHLFQLPQYEVLIALGSWRGFIPCPWFRGDPSGHALEDVLKLERLPRLKAWCVVRENGGTIRGDGV